MIDREQHPRSQSRSYFSEEKFDYDGFRTYLANEKIRILYLDEALSDPSHVCSVIELVSSMVFVPFFCYIFFVLAFLFGKILILSILIEHSE